ncbi:MAG: NADH-quinone oxidoreductase subunit L [Dehalococcoidales bacterium]|nr:NADH-quinone oxidoreductase subunit L [Dehalococcoidales bacterium]
MNFEQIRAEAEPACDYLKKDNGAIVRIGASADHPALADVVNRFQQDIDKAGIKVKVIAAGSYGLDDLEPIVSIEKPGSPALLYRCVTPEVAAELVNRYLAGGSGESELAHGGIDDVPALKLQNRIALRNCGYIDPENINEYVIRGNGYGGLARALAMESGEVIGELEKVGLRGRGGAGYPAAEKWKTCRETESDEKYVICDAMDADPEACTARLLIEGDPHSVLEGMLIGAYAVGACRGFICVNSGYKAAIKRLEKALEQMRGYGLLGESVLDSPFKFDIEIKAIEPSLVAGEETALIRTLEGRQAIPYLRTVYPAASGLAGKPTLVNNAETLSHVSTIIQNGVDAVPDTKVITLSGDVAHKYTVEVPFGTTLRSVVSDIGGATDIKAVQFGGPTGYYFNADSLDIPIDYESMEKVGGIVGSGTVKVYDNNHCAVEIAKDAMAFLQAQSCGKCVFCREGTYQMLDILNDIAENKGKPEDIDMLLELAGGMKTGSICGLGRTAPNPVVSSIELFRSDYDAHIKGKKCPKKP